MGDLFMTLEEYIERGIYHHVDIISSYHNHNYLCGHALGNVKDYIDVAVKKGYQIFGISDHGYIPQMSDRMNRNDFFNNYLKQFEEIKDYNIIVKKGLEFEYFKENIDLYKEMRKYVDYLVLGEHIFYRNGKLRSVHYDELDDEDFILYEKNCIEGLKTGLFDFIAHPEIAFYNIENISETGMRCLENIVKYCTENDIIMEVNVNGLRRKPIGKVRYRYPRQEYLDLLKKYHTKVIVSDDAHVISEINDDYTKITYSYLEDEGFNLLYELEF